MSEHEKRMRVLISAYACEPEKGSEPAVGWNIACGMATYHDVWVVTRANNRRIIETNLKRTPVDGLHFIYYDLPNWVTWWKRRGHGIQIYYYLWQIGVLKSVRQANRKLNFDLAHHVTFVKYWAPSFLAWMNIPYLWGPVGGGESAPKAFYNDFSIRGLCFEKIRDGLRRLAEYDPLVRRTAQRCTIALATTPETRKRITAVSNKPCEQFSQVGLSEKDFIDLSQDYEKWNPSPFRFISIGNLLHLKGFHLGIRAFAMANLPEAEYWIIGNGPERKRLEKLALELKIERQVKFAGRKPRGETLKYLGASSVLVHPSLHDSGGFVCLEAMAAGKPVICLNSGGPAMLVSKDCGIVIPANTPAQVVNDITKAMLRLAKDTKLNNSLGKAGRQRVLQFFNWQHKCEIINEYYRRITMIDKDRSKSQKPRENHLG